MEWYLKVLKQFAVFSGRARRKEFWMFCLINCIIAFGVGFVAGLIKLPFLSLLYTLAIIIPALAVGIRRLHDIGKSGWMILVSFIPIIGAIWLIILYAKEGESGDNEYGADPKAATATATATAAA